MSDLSVIVKVTSKNQKINVTKQLVSIKSDSSTTCYDVINSLSQNSSLLQHILTYIRHYSTTNSNQNDDNKTENTSNISIDKTHIEICASFKEESQELIQNVPMNEPLYTLLNRFQWKILHFLISDDLLFQSQLFLTHISNQNPTFQPENFPSFSKHKFPQYTYEGSADTFLDHKGHEFSYKRFYNRASPITAREVANMAEITSLYHISFALLIVFLTGILTKEALEKGVVYNFELLSWNFGQADKVFLIWCGMFCYSFLFVTLLHQYRLRSIDRLNFGVFYFSLIVPLIWVPFRMIRYLNLPVASGAIIACEQMRFIMKGHAYMFEMFRALHFGDIFHNNISGFYLTHRISSDYQYLKKDWIYAWNQCMEVSQIKHYTPQQTDDSGFNGWSTPTKTYDYPYPGSSPVPVITQQNIPNKFNNNIPVVVQIAHYPYHLHVQSFLNFLFCPSLVYRWSYPTTKTKVNGDISYKINWVHVFGQLINMWGCLLFVFVIFYVFICPSFVNTPYEPFTLTRFLSGVFSAAMPGMLLVTMVFLGVTHCWLNMWSELLGYCDRIFYEDWWNANTFASYSKKWNLVVYNWSYNYFFLPMLEAGYSKATADLFTFWLWAAIQEYVFFAVSGCFYPVLLSSCIIYGVLFYSVPFTDSIGLRYYNNTGYVAKTDDEISSIDNGQSQNGVWNVFLWIMLFLQNGFFVSLYAREWYTARAYESGAIVLS
eukprot:250754_1